MASYWFIPLIVESIILLICIAYEAGILSTLSVIATALVVHFGFVNLIDVASNNWKGILLGFAGYVVAGTVWSFVKWALYVINKRTIYKEDKAKFLKNYDGGGKQEEAQKAWLKTYRSGKHEPPQVSEHKERIALWFFYWPFSMVNTVIKDFTKKLFNLVYNTVKNTFQEVSNRIYTGIDEE